MLKPCKDAFHRGLGQGIIGKTAELQNKGGTAYAVCMGSNLR